MADKKISELTALTTPDGTEELVVNDGGVSKKITQANLFKLGDNVKAQFGAGNDLQIYHDETNSRIHDEGTGRLIIASDGDGVDINKGTSENIAKFRSDSACSFYYDNNLKLATTSTGIDVTGVTTTDGLTSSSNITFDNGNSSVSIKSDGADGSYIQFGSNEYLRFLYDNGASESIRLIDGGGITFNGDTAAANALDDYEEGTWTATLASGATTTPTATGHYTKIGREVHIYLYVNFGSIAVNGTVLQISGLPFTPNHSTTGSMGYTARVQMQSTAHHFTAVDSGVTTVTYRYMSANVGGSSELLTQSSGTFTPAFQIAMTYNT